MNEIEVVPTPVHVVRGTPRARVVDLTPLDIYAARRWRFLHARPVKPNRYLDEGEHCRHARPLHWAGLIHALFAAPHLKALRNKTAAKVNAAVVTTVLGAAYIGMWQAQVLLGLATAAHSVGMVWRGLGWRASAIIVTNRRLICPRGVIGRAVASTELHRITDHECYQSWLGRWLGYGTLRIESGGKHDLGAERELIRFVRDPELVDSMLGVRRPT